MTDQVHVVNYVVNLALHSFENTQERNYIRNDSSISETICQIHFYSVLLLCSRPIEMTSYYISRGKLHPSLRLLLRLHIFSALLQNPVSRRRFYFDYMGWIDEPLFFVL